MIKHVQKNILILGTALSYFATAHAEMSYGSKFLLTTAGGCGAGALTGYTVARTSDYDSLPTKTVTWLGAATGCLSGAIISYFVYNDKSERLNTRLAAQQKTIQDLNLQLATLQGQKQNGIFHGSLSNPNLRTPFDSLIAREGIAKGNFDPKKLPTGLKIKSCDRLWQYTLVGDGNDVNNVVYGNRKIVAVNKNFALVGFTFLYSPQECFNPSEADGVYAETYFPELTNFLQTRVQNWTADYAAK